MDAMLVVDVQVYLDAVSVIRHHHWVWSNLVTQRSIKVAADQRIAAVRVVA